MTGHGSVRSLTLSLVALLLLAGLSLGLWGVHLGTLGMPVALGIAVMKALIILVFFMEILTERATVRFAFATGLALLGLMLLLVVADVVTRSPAGPYPPGTAERQRG